MLNSTNGPMLAPGIPDLTVPRPTRTKVKLVPTMLPMFCTICPAQIVGSKDSEGFVVLVLEGVGLPKTEFSTIALERQDEGRVLMTIEPLS